MRVELPRIAKGAEYVAVDARDSRVLESPDHRSLQVNMRLRPLCTGAQYYLAEPLPREFLRHFFAHFKMLSRNARADGGGDVAQRTGLAHHANAAPQDIP